MAGPLCRAATTASFLFYYRLLVNEIHCFTAGFIRPSAQSLNLITEMGHSNKVGTAARTDPAPDEILIHSLNSRPAGRSLHTAEFNGLGGLLLRIAQNLPIMPAKDIRIPSASQ